MTEKNTAHPSRPWVKWYKRKSWLDLRRYQLQEEPFCRLCRPELVEARVVDHIKDHKGDPALFMDRGNLQSLCHDCHRRKTIMENPAHGASMIPAWMPEAKKPFFLVCGPPASGKSTYVRQHAAHGDLVIDLDDLAEKFGKPLVDMTDAERDGVIRYRNSLLGDFMHGKTAHPRCWLVAVAACPSHIAFWEKRHAKIMVINPDKELCRRRVRERDLTPDRQDYAINGINAWGHYCRVNCNHCDRGGCDASGFVPGWRDTDATPTP